MADKKLDFILALRRAASMLNPHVVTDTPDHSSEDFGRALRRAALWLTPGVVKDYDPSFFPELHEPELSQLTENVQAFKKLAEEVPARCLPTEPLYTSALKHLTAILDLLRPYLMLDTRMFQAWIAVDEALSELPQVLAVFPRIDEDSSGEESVFIDVILDDVLSPESKDFSLVTREAKDRARKAINAALPGHWPYVDFHSKSEHQQVTGWSS